MRGTVRHGFVTCAWSCHTTALLQLAAACVWNVTALLCCYWQRCVLWAVAVQLRCTPQRSVRETFTAQLNGKLVATCACTFHGTALLLCCKSQRRVCETAATRHCCIYSDLCGCRLAATYAATSSDLCVELPLYRFAEARGCYDAALLADCA